VQDQLAFSAVSHRPSSTRLYNAVLDVPLSFFGALVLLYLSLLSLRLRSPLVVRLALGLAPLGLLLPPLALGLEVLGRLARRAQELVELRASLYQSSASLKVAETRAEAERVERTLSRRIRRASLRFDSRERVSWQWTRRPVGRWINEHALDVLFVAWPPGPEPARW